jgi:predicted lipoprotein with Yx(FWY)xxD motif
MLRFLTPPLLVVALLTAVGCGSSDGGGSSTAAPAATAAVTAAKAQTDIPGAGAATVSTASGKLGTFLVDAQGATLYLWEKDTGSTSACTGACAAGWPPLLTKGAPKASGSAVSSRLGTTKRSDGTTQVTYGGHPLYTFAGDTAAGQTTGQDSNAFGASWYVVAPSGKAIDSEDGGSSGGGGTGGY